MPFTKEEIDAQRNFVKVLEYKLEQVNNELNEKYREHAQVHNRLSTARYKLYEMQD